MLSGSVGILVLIMFVFVVVLLVVIVRIGRCNLFTFRSTKLWFLLLGMLSMVATMIIAECCPARCNAPCNES